MQKESLNANLKSSTTTTTTTPADLPVSTCSGCELSILDRYLLEVSGLQWHAQCLKCTICLNGLECEILCYLKNKKVYCKNDYQRLFGTKCSKCGRTISPTDWVRRAKDQVYHLACFACDGCKRQLSTGEEFALADDKVLCKLHFTEIFDGDENGGSSNEDSCDGESSSSSSKSKTKRVRTTFTDEQIQVLQANFQLDSNPDGQDLERIAQITGLSKRVTQVWFQNSRARQKKHMAKQKKGINGGGGYHNNNNINNNLHHHHHLGTNSSLSFDKTSIIVSDSDSTSGASASPLTTMIYSFT